MKRILKPKIKIEFGNLKEDFKSNFYLATEERAVENKVYKGKMNGENYVTVYDGNVPNGKRKINLKYFNNYNITYL